MGLRLLVNGDLPSVDQALCGKNEKNLGEKLEELRRWQTEQQNNLLKQQHQQFLQLRQEQENIQRTLQRKQIDIKGDEDNLYNMNRVKEIVMPTMACTPSSWNKLVLPHSSPAERMERAAQLRALLREAEMKTSVSSDTHSEIDGICSLPESSNSIDNSILSQSPNSNHDSNTSDKYDSKNRDSVDAESTRKNQLEGNKSRRIDDQLNELQIAESTKTNTSDRPKHPFLRKGQSLLRYKSKAMLNKKSTDFSKPKSKPKTNPEANTKETTKIEEKKIILRETNENATIDHQVLPRKEDDSLSEFEMLERASEETSFCSTSSIVVKALQTRTYQSQFGAKQKTLKNNCNLPKISEGGEIREEIKQNWKHEQAVEAQSSKNRDEDLTSEPLEFKDDETWHTESENSYCGSDGESLALSSLNCSPAAPSKLMTHYFTALKPPVNPPKEQVGLQANIRGKDERVPQRQQENVNENIGSMKTKMTELEVELEKFQRENEALIKLNRNQRLAMQQLERDKRNFEMYKEQEEQKMIEWIENEKKKLKRERGLYDAYLKTRPQFDRHERKRINQITQQLEDTKAVLKTREMKWNASQTRLQDRINLLEEENKCLKAELQNLSRKNLEQLQKIKEANCTKITNDLIPSKESVSPQKFVTNFADSASGDASSPSSSESDENEWIEDEANTTRIRADLSNDDSFCLDCTFTLLDSKDVVVDTIENEDESVEKIYANGIREIIYSNGTRKEISADGSIVLVFLFNGDIKHVFLDKKIVYYFSENGTTNTTYPDGLQVFHFANSQIEKHFPDGTKEIIFPDQSCKLIYADGAEESMLADGTIVQTTASGDCIMSFTNGQKEIHTDKFKKRTFLDGTVKFVYPNGQEETRYSNGRLRIKDKTGKLILDQKLK